MGNRLENLRKKLDCLLKDNEPDKVCMYVSHMYGVSKFCILLAKKRSLDPELAALCGMLHDIGYMSGGGSNNHAKEGAKLAETFLKEMKVFNDVEINLITTAISNHSDKCNVHGDYDELLKDADVMDHCFYNNDFLINEREIVRYRKLLAEFGIKTTL